MRLIFINHAHPDIPHVSGMRLSYFAKAMAGRGHQVVLITSTYPDQSRPVASPADQLKRLDTHDWSAPFHLEIMPFRLKALEWIRTNRLPAPVRRTLTFWHMAYHGGVFEDWVVACRPHARDLASSFRPELVWGTFGNTSNLVLAQFIARQAGCPWVMDIKDNWATFIRPGLREWLAWRFRDASGYTCNAAHHQAVAAKWLHQGKGRVIYSGVAEEFLNPMAVQSDSATRDLILVGGTYDQAVLIQFLQGIKSWLSKLDPAKLSSIRFVYVGSDSQRVKDALNRINLPCKTAISGYLSIKVLAHQCRQALANCYVWASFGFHHKLLELLSCGRPVVAFPGEAEESKALAAQSATPFSACTDERALHSALDHAWATYGLNESDTNAKQWQWQALAVQLEEFFIDCKQEQAA